MGEVVPKSCPGRPKGCQEETDDDPHLKHNTVFTYSRMPIKSIKSCLNRACSEAGIEDFHFHDLRHTFNTMMRKAGFRRSVIKHFTGHKTSAMFDRYNTIDDEDAREALRKLNAFLEGAG